MINEKNFGLRLSKLRIKKDVSARDMSLSLGQNASYINNIETSKALPSMTMFFKICNFLEITPYDFFRDDIESPKTNNELSENLKKLSGNQIDTLNSFIKTLI